MLLQILHKTPFYRHLVGREMWRHQSKEPNTGNCSRNVKALLWNQPKSCVMRRCAVWRNWDSIASGLVRINYISIWTWKHKYKYVATNVNFRGSLLSAQTSTRWSTPPMRINWRAYSTTTGTKSKTWHQYLNTWIESHTVVKMNLSRMGRSPTALWPHSWPAWPVWSCTSTWMRCKRTLSTVTQASFQYLVICCVLNEHESQRNYKFISILQIPCSTFGHLDHMCLRRAIS